MSYSKVPFVLACLLLGALIVACQPAGSAETPQVRIAASEYAFDALDSVPAGWTQFELVNNGTELHHAQLIRLEEGKTIDDVMAALQSDEVPTWAITAGGPSVAAPGPDNAVSATVNLQPGNYILICFLPDAEGVPHAAKGMVRPLTVSEAEGESAPAPEPDIELVAKEFAFDLPESLTAGEQTFHLDNQGQQDHEAFVVKLEEGVTPEQFLAAVEDPSAGPPPGLPAGGFQAIPPGSEGYFTVDMTPGNYAFICFVGDEETGAPHFALGMLSEVTVE
ncbi:MAG: hypothetical protein ACRDHL_01300 [Candidatus Promineifilaceae bacterium]